MTGTVTSADGTVLTVDRSGSGPAVVLVHGAFTDRTHPILREVAEALAPWFTVHNYDRRGRGGSGDTAPYAVDREVDDLAAIIEAAGGSAMVFGGSSGAALALTAAARLPAITKLALWEPPYHVDDSAPFLPDDFADRLTTLVADGRRGEAVERFLVQAAEVPADIVAAMRAGPAWAQAEALAHTLAYEAAVLGAGNALPTGLLAAVTQPTLVMAGDHSPGWLPAAARAVAGGLPRARYRTLPGQTHAVASESLAPELLEFFVTG